MNPEEPIHGDTRNREALKAAWRLLSLRPRTSSELERRLATRFGSQAASWVIGHLRETGYLDDRSFASLWTRSRVEAHPRSASLIRRELAQKGVERELAEEATSGLDDEETAYAAALQGARHLKGEPFPVFRRKLWGYLMRRGFSHSLARRLVHRVWIERRHDQQ